MKPPYDEIINYGLLEIDIQPQLQGLGFKGHSGALPRGQHKRDLYIPGHNIDAVKVSARDFR